MELDGLQGVSTRGHAQTLTLHSAKRTFRAQHSVFEGELEWILVLLGHALAVLLRRTITDGVIVVFIDVVLVCWQLNDPFCGC